MSTPKNKNEVRLLDHEYDGIREYDQRLPNWWLFTLYAAIVFAVGYWFFYFQTNPFDDDITRLHARMAEVEQARLEASLKMLNNQTLWEMSRNDAFVAEGRKHFMQNCTACHNTDLTGGIGFNLVDNEWIHGAKPTDIFKTVADGVQGTAMQSWEPLLGSKKIAETVAFVLSYHEMPQDYGIPVGANEVPSPNQ